MSLADKLFNFLGEQLSILEFPRRNSRERIEQSLGSPRDHIAECLGCGVCCVAFRRGFGLQVVPVIRQLENNVEAFARAWFR